VARLTLLFYLMLGLPSVRHSALLLADHFSLIDVSLSRNNARDELLQQLEISFSSCKFLLDLVKNNCRTF